MDYGPAELQVGPLSLRVLRREFPNLTGYWDANWLQVEARVVAPGAQVEFAGPHVRTEEIQRFADQLAVMHSSLAGCAELACMEPYLSVRLACNACGHVVAVFKITPDPTRQTHEFEAQIDQTYLAPMIASCGEILRRYPVVGVP